MLDAGYWILDVGCWMLGVRMLETFVASCETTAIRGRGGEFCPRKQRCRMRKGWEEGDCFEEEERDYGRLFFFGFEFVNEAPEVEFELFDRGRFVGGRFNERPWFGGRLFVRFVAHVVSV
jgi:hypothetical protein